MAGPLIVFLLCAATVIICGMKLSLYGDEVAERTHAGGALVGVFLIAVVTSLPELVISITSGARSAADFAVGNVLGSNLYNITIIAVADGFFCTGALLSVVNPRLLLSCTLGLLLTTITAIALFLKSSWHIGWVGVDTMLLPAAYLMCLGLIGKAHRQERQAIDALARENPEGNFPPPAITGGQDRVEGVPAGEACRDRREMLVQMRRRPLEDLTKRALWFRLTTCALVIIAAGPFAVASAERLAHIWCLGETFVGSFLLAVVGSLPEMVVAICAVRIGAYDMAVGNVFGSNLFNMVILFISDLFYTRGPILRDASSEHIITALFVILLTNIVMVGLLYRSRRVVAGLGPDSIAVLVSYIAAVLFLFTRAKAVLP